MRLSWGTRYLLFSITVHLHGPRSVRSQSAHAWRQASFTLHIQTSYICTGWPFVRPLSLALTIVMLSLATKDLR